MCQLGGQRRDGRAGGVELLRIIGSSRTASDGAGGRRLVEQTGWWRTGYQRITVKAHRRRAMRKMKAKSLPDLVRMAAELRATRKVIHLA